MPPLPVSAKHRRRARQRKAILLVVATLVIPFLATRALVLNRIALPRFEKDLGIEIAKGSLNYSPLGGFRISNLEATGRDSDEIFLKAERANLKLNYLAAFLGAKQIPEFMLSNVEIRLTQDSEGELTPKSFIKSRFARRFESSSEGVQIHRLELNNARIIFTQQLAGKLSRVVDLKEIQLEMSRPRGATNGIIRTKGSWEISALRSLTPDSPRQLLGKTGGNASCSLAFSQARYETLQSVDFTAEANATTGEGVFEEMTRDQLSAHYMYSNDRIQSAELLWSRGATPLIDASISQVNSDPNSENRMRIKAISRDLGFSDIWTRPRGIKLTGDQLTLAAEWFLNSAKTRSILQGTLSTSQLTSHSTTGSTPPIDISLTLNTLSDQLEKTLLLDKDSRLDIQRSGDTIFSITLDRQLNIAYGDNLPNYKPATALASVKDLDLSEWAALFPSNVRPKGIVNGSLTLSSSEDARRIQTTAQFSGKDFQIEFESQGRASVSNRAEFELSGTGGVVNFERFSVKELTASLRAIGDASPFVDGGLRLERDQSLENTRGSANLKTRLPELAHWLNDEAFHCSDGVLDVSLELDEDARSSVFEAEFNANRFSGAVLGRDFRNIAVRFNPQFSIDENTIKLNKLTLHTRHDARDGAKIAMRGDALKSGARGHARIDIDLVSDTFFESLDPQTWRALALGTTQVSGSIDVSKDRNQNLKVSPSLRFITKPISSPDISMDPPTLDGGFESDLERASEGWSISTAKFVLRPTAGARSGAFSLNKAITLSSASSQPIPHPIIEANHIDATRLGPFLGYLAQCERQPISWFQDSNFELTLRIDETTFEDTSVRNWENHFTVSEFPSISEFASQLLPQDIFHKVIRSNDLWSPYSTISNKTLNNPSND